MLNRHAILWFVVTCACNDGKQTETPTAVAVPTIPRAPYTLQSFPILGDAEAQIWYLGHSGFAVRTRTKMLIFDYSQNRPARRDTAGLTSGTISLEEISGQETFFFVSNADNFNPEIFLQMQRKDASLPWIVSSDVYDIMTSLDTAMTNVRVLRLYRRTPVDNMIVRSIKANDGGVAYHVLVDGLQIYFGGGHAWWAWSGSNKRLETEYKSELDRMIGSKIDLAFLPVDPRLRSAGFAGASYFIERFKPVMVFPMREPGENASESLALKDAVASWAGSEIALVGKRGVSFSYRRQ